MNYEHINIGTGVVKYEPIVFLLLVKEQVKFKDPAFNITSQDTADKLR